MPSLLRMLSADHLLESMRYNTTGSNSSLSPELKSELDASGDKPISGKKVTVYMPTCHIIDNQETEWWWLGGKYGDVYIVALSVDLSGTGQDLNGLFPKKESQIFKNIARTASAKMNISVTPLFNNVTDDYDLPLSGDGIVLYGPKDPKGLLSLHVAIMEDDNGYRQLGKIIEDCAKASDLTSLIEKVATIVSLANPTVELLKNGFDLFYNSVITGLKNNDDDIIQDFQFSSLAHQDYLDGVHQINGDGAKLSFTVDVK